MVFSLLGVAATEMLPWLFSSFSVIVEVEGERENVLARGPRWVSFSSVYCHVSPGDTCGKGGYQRRWDEQCIECDLGLED